MKIEIVLDPARPPPLSARVAPAARPTARPAAVVSMDTDLPTPRDGATRGRRGRGARGRGGAKRREARPKKSEADLDAEMEDYTAGSATATA